MNPSANTSIELGNHDVIVLLASREITKANGFSKWFASFNEMNRI